MTIKENGMRIVLFGAGGKIGRAIADEMLLRSYEVTGVTRGGNVAGSAELAITAKAADVTNPDVVVDLIKDHDAVASAVGPRLGVDDDEAILVGAARSLITAMRKTKLRRLVVLGGAGGLEVSPGVRVIDQPDFPPIWKKNALAQINALVLYRKVDDLDWTVVSPAAVIEPGERTGMYRLGGDQLLVDAAGKSRISIADYAIAFVDELERGNAIRQRITVAY
jgi:uncharacterized protein